MADVRLEIDIPEILPADLPVMALRRGVLFPGTMTAFTVGRRASIAALDAARGNLLLVAVQREPMADPAPSDLLPIATLARVHRRQALPNGTELVICAAVLAQLLADGLELLAQHELLLHVSGLLGDPVLDGAPGIGHALLLGDVAQHPLCPREGIGGEQDLRALVVLDWDDTLYPTSTSSTPHSPPHCSLWKREIFDF